MCPFPVMKKWGHQEGQGLGRQGDGIVHALAAENIDPTKKKSKGGWVQASSSKGKLINTNEDIKKKEEKEKYGEPSQVVCLSNLVAGPDEVDDDLQADIGEECGKNGLAEPLQFASGEYR
jgi:splicing factor 45